MTLQEFQNEINKLKNVFSDKSYPNERIEQIWLWAKKIDAKDFIEVVSRVIAECDRAPLLGKLKETFIQIRAGSPTKKFNCVYCDGSGFILDRRINIIGIAYACRCQAGDLVPGYVARWAGTLEKVVPTHAEINWRVLPNTAIKKVIEEKNLLPNQDESIKTNDENENEDHCPF